MFPSVFQRGDLDIAGQFADEGSSGKELPPSAAGVAEDCRPDGRFAAWLIADLVQFTHRFVLPRLETLQRQYSLPSPRNKAGFVPNDAIDSPKE